MKGLWNNMSQMVVQSLQWQLDLKANRQGLERKIKNNHENGREYAMITKTLYQNLMLDRQVLKTKEKLI